MKASCAEAGPSPPAFAPLRAEPVFLKARHRRRKAAQLDLAASCSHVVHSCVRTRPCGFWQVDTSWKVLVVDSVSVRVISAACSMSEVLSNDHQTIAHAHTRTHMRSQTDGDDCVRPGPVVRQCADHRRGSELGRKPGARSRTDGGYGGHLLCVSHLRVHEGTHSPKSV